MTNDAPYFRIIAETMTWGSWGKQLSKADMIDLIHHCIELGISTFDHADIPPRPNSEMLSKIVEYHEKTYG